MFDSTAGSQSNTTAAMMNSLNSLHKQQNETPQFAGMTACDEYENDMNLLPSAATQPIQNIFYPTTNPNIDEHIGGGYASSGMQPGQATPNQTAALGNLFNSHDF